MVIEVNNSEKVSGCEPVNISINIGAGTLYVFL